MSLNDFKKKKKCKTPNAFHTLQLAGIILMSFGVTTLCAFLLPLKVWVFLLGIILLACGLLLLYC